MNGGQDLTREVELNAAQSRFISNVSHEPCAHLCSKSRATWKRSPRPAAIQISGERKPGSFLAKLPTPNRSSQTRLVNEVLDLSRLGIRSDWGLEPIELRPAIEQTVRNYRLNAIEKGVEFDNGRPTASSRVMGDWDQDPAGARQSRRQCPQVSP